MNLAAKLIVQCRSPLYRCASQQAIPTAAPVHRLQPAASSFALMRTSLAPLCEHSSTLRPTPRTRGCGLQPAASCAMLLMPRTITTRSPSLHRCTSQPVLSFAPPRPPPPIQCPASCAARQRTRCPAPSNPIIELLKLIAKLGVAYCLIWLTFRLGFWRSIHPVKNSFEVVGGEVVSLFRGAEAEAEAKRRNK